jgi:hypothetical protein
MKVTICFLLVGIAALCGISKPSLADEFREAPAEAALLPADESGVAKVAMRFDLSSLRSGEHRRIEQALLEWTLTGTSDADMTEYVVYAAQASWSESAIASGSVPVHGEEPAAEWLLQPRKAGEKGAGLVRLDITELVRSWADGGQPNYGVIVATSALGREVLGGQLDQAKLTIRYGFLGD